MPRILGVDLPNDKPTHISLRYIYGIGPTLALRLCEQARIDPQRRAKELTDEEISRLTNLLDRDYVVEGPLRRQVQQNIARLRDINCYRGMRHRRGLPTRGQRTRTNGRARRGPKRAVAGRKKKGK
jgi:small subunit ribosomal protein S13